MTNRRLRCAAVLAAVGAMAMPAAASAGPFTPVGFVVGEYHATQPLSGDTDKSDFALLFVNSGTNTQAVQGDFGGAPFTGVASHTYDRANDHVTYTVAGSVDPTGATPPAPALITFGVEVDRIDNTRKVSVNGSLAGTPIVGYSRTFTTIPTLDDLI